MRTNRTAVFIDGANVHSTTKALGVDIDYKRLLEYFGDNLLRANYYTALRDESPDSDFQSIRPLLDWLEYNGYSVISKQSKTFVDANGRTKTKGNMDCEMIVDMMMIAPHVDRIVLFSGDGDFAYALKTMRSMGVRMEVISSILTDPPMIADELRRVCDSFVELSELIHKIGRPSQKAVVTGRSRYVS